MPFSPQSIEHTESRINTMRLQAAAPDLLAALEQAEAALSDALAGGEYWRENAEAGDLPIIRTAIAKAKGE